MPREPRPVTDWNTLLTFVAVLDDFQRVRIANENRLWALARRKSGPGSPGVKEAVVFASADSTLGRLRILVEEGRRLEERAVKDVRRLMKDHPLGPLVASLKGVGELTAARLLGSIKDPYWAHYERDGEMYDGPRTLPQLYSLCGYGLVDNIQAQRHQRGVQGNWNDTARMRVFLCSEGVVKSRCRVCTDAERERRVEPSKPAAWAPAPPGCTCVEDGYELRARYDRYRAEHVGSVHPVLCVRCGPKGKPAEVGSVRSAGHVHAMAVRYVGKQILRALWQESRRLHETGVLSGHEETVVQSLAYW